jgi:hypothetical protein
MILKKKKKYLQKYLENNIKESFQKSLVGKLGQFQEMKKAILIIIMH